MCSRICRRTTESVRTRKAESDVSTFQRRGHWRRGRDGGMHWVSGHSVTRDGSSTWRRPAAPSRKAPRYSTPFSRPPVLWRQIPSEPNANCPVCGARVYFFRNKQGGCAYFSPSASRGRSTRDIPVFQFDEDAVRQAKLAFESAQKMAGSPTPAMRLDGEGRATWRAQRATGKSDLHAHAWRQPPRLLAGAPRSNSSPSRRRNG